MLIDNRDLEKLANVVLTIGVVSNHGNWFTSDTQNKEMRVLAQSFDWLLFLTDLGLAEFIEDVTTGCSGQLEATREAFELTYSGTAKGTSFTKISIDAEADRELTTYFADRDPWNEWFNVITPVADLDELRYDLQRMRDVREANI